MTKTSLTTVLTEGVAPSLDALFSALEFVPGVGIAIGFLKIKDDFQSRMMTAKLKAFLEGIGEQSHEDVQAMAEKFNDPDKKQTMGETLLLTLNSYTTLDKCELLGNLFKCFLNGVLTSSELRRLALAINGAFDEDIQAFISYYVDELHEDDGFLDYLSLVGLAYEKRPENPSWESVGRGPIVLTHLGQKLVKALRHIHGKEPLRAAQSISETL